MCLDVVVTTYIRVRNVLHTPSPGLINTVPVPDATKAKAGNCLRSGKAGRGATLKV